MEIIKPVDREEVSEGAELGALGSGVLSILSSLAIFFVFTVENGSVCYFPPDGEIWASGVMVEATAPPAPELGAGAALGEVVTLGTGAAPAKTETSLVVSFLKETGRLVASSRASSIISLVFLALPPFVSVNIFAFI